MLQSASFLHPVKHFTTGTQPYQKFLIQLFSKSWRSLEAEPLVARRNGRNPPACQELGGLGDLTFAEGKLAQFRFAKHGRSEVPILK